MVGFGNTCVALALGGHYDVVWGMKDSTYVTFRSTALGIARFVMVGFCRAEI